MEARNAAGRRVSLLNDESTSYEKVQLHHHKHHIALPPSAGHALSRPYPSPRSSSSSPNTPELLRSDSYDSQMSNDPISPLTPSADYAHPRRSLYASDLPTKRPAYVDSSRSTSYEDDAPAPSAQLPADRPGKRYPCRYRDSHGCEKTFTTSGHASRHSKIHTAEKAVQCTYPGCQKKFTRADNMKQHLETHYKDKSRSSASQRAQKAVLAEARRNSSTSRSRSSASTTTTSHEAMQWESDAYVASTQPLASPSASSWELRTHNLPLLNRPAVARSPSSGLDALAMAVACQEGSRRQ
ncbi:Zinc finger, C2H2-type/integrase, DNA-binding protein [Metarhizium album ARSEF 1941]|uniref:C2H2 type master regulator of conidiophore development brlA n=1 Tax=Metarhizium album (strain ARSEF 1941) TaxID=1081103 RepID=A0A0B2WY40_METAS|nr:Zinc finger, C2H2-type/integrase, DNA-binding protein [Metarhizium album ARSEF 1941]XP_040679585.1 Zinc finger, C2H2-type/integrase, DNA-binding protein [Metarhizium album ARSEF 1941]KHN93675.1 Zinc finger, C2H2-type/integrase, DNA-binding protein [Metarhizium album ARSEF 1941]KHN98519.1 Zinc finger, C2H2-type/integrase, DNA-binding protein [Metarhizium album ARSEF 1941]